MTKDFSKAILKCYKLSPLLKTSTLTALTVDSFLMGGTVFGLGVTVYIRINTIVKLPTMYEGHLP